MSGAGRLNDTDEDAFLNLKRITSISLAALMGLAGGCFSSTGTDAEGALASQSKCITPEDSDRMADEVLQLVNLERAEHGLPPVSVSPILAKVAEDYACRMIAGKFFSHTDPLTGQGPAARAVEQNYTFYSIGENLATGQETASEVMKIWMASPPHHALVLDPSWRELGVAVRSADDGTVFWVQEFGDPFEF